MENLIYFIVKIMAAAYLLHSLFQFLFGKKRKKRKNLWNFLTPKQTVKKNKPVTMPEQKTVSSGIVGKSQTVYLEKSPERKPPVPFLSEDLEKAPSYEEEPEDTNDDVEYKSESYTAEEILSEEERFMSFDSPPEEGESTGMTFQQISMVMDVVQGKKVDDDTRSEVAQILNEIGDCDLFNFLTAQAENEILVERLLKENLDDADSSAPENIGKKRKEIEEFDMDKYV